MTFGSLFAGIGGMDLGLERAGMHCAWQVEINPYAQRVLAKHWPDVRRHNDVRTFPPSDPSDWRVDLIAGGFPCQDISYAGKGAGLEGARSGLFYEAMRVIGEVGPRFIVLENVAALLTRGMDRVLGTLASFGIDAEWHCLPAAEFGAPHIRNRVFILGHMGRNSHCINDGAVEARNHQNAITERIGREATPEVSSDTNSARLAKRQGEDSSGARAICRTKPGRSEWWNTEPAVGRVANGIPCRMDRLTGLGNAVVPQIAEYIGRRIMEVA